MVLLKHRYMNAYEESQNHFDLITIMIRSADSLFNNNSYVFTEEQELTKREITTKEWEDFLNSVDSSVLYPSVAVPEFDWERSNKEAFSTSEDSMYIWISNNQKCQ